MSLPTNQPLHTRPVPLSTNADLEAEQDAFFRAQLTSTGQTDASLSFSKPPASTTAVLLQPVLERNVARRRRPRHLAQSRHAFPPCDKENEFNLRRFARHKDSASSEQADIDNKSGSQENDLGHPNIASVNQNRPSASLGKSNSDHSASSLLEAMTEDQIRDAQAEIASVLSPENIKFLRQRRRSRLRVSSSPSQTLSTENVSLPADLNVQTKDVTDQDLHTDLPQICANAQLNASERDKRLWMSDTDLELPEQQDLDHILAEVVKNLGPIGQQRFNLTGKLLSPSEVDGLPTHLGLHHHGASPASAGYTLSEVLLLTRSTVPSQRILALRLLASLVIHYRTEIIQELLGSGGLGLAFAVFPSYSSLNSSLTNQIAYLEAVEALVNSVWDIPRDKLVPDFYFASRFYSSALRQAPHPILCVLAESGCIAILARIAKASSCRPDQTQIALRSLNMIRAIVTSSTRASRALLFKDDTVNILQQLVVGMKNLLPSTTLLAGDVLAQAIIQVGWGGSDIIEALESNVLNEVFLRTVSSHLGWFLRYGSEGHNEVQLYAANGVMRLLRSALAFEKGILAFTGVAQAICRLAHEDGETSTEAYFALEAYAHVLYTKLSKGSGGGDDLFVKDQLAELIPAALSGSTLFTSKSGNVSPSRKAAAGHFAATILAMSTIPLDESVIAKIFCECAILSKALQEQRVKDVTTLKEVQALASASHAGARILSRIRLDPLFANREVQRIFTSARSEAQFLTLPNDIGHLVPWRPVANTCSEWVGALAKVDCGMRTLEKALRLLPFLYDPQVVVDLLSRCLLRVHALVLLNPALSKEEAGRCSQDLLPVTLEDVSNLQCYDLEKYADTRAEEENGKSDVSVTMTTNSDLSMICLMRMWLARAEVSSSGLKVAMAFFKGDLIDPLELLWVLMNVPIDIISILTTELFGAICTLANATAQKGTSLVLKPGDSVLTSVSTTPYSKFTTFMTAVTDFLVARGPTCIESVAEAHENCHDPLASLVFTMMLCKDVHVSLREVLWQKSIEECGGGSLFSNACDLIARRRDRSEDFKAMAEEDAFVSRVCTALVRGLLTGERCPPVLGSVIVSMLAARIQMGPAKFDALSELKGALKDERRAVVEKTVEGMLHETLMKSTSLSVLAKWMQIQIHD